jgi:hypothetical protein
MFKIEGRLKNQGSYGNVYKAKWNGKRIVLKENLNPDINLHHEYLISLQLQKTKCSQFFSKSLYYGINNKKQQLAIEWIDHDATLLEIIDDLSREKIDNIFQHLCHIFLWAQKECQFVHNDMHLNNILLVPTKQKFYKYPSGILHYMGLKPIIIDFGFSHCVNVDGLESTLTQTHRGMHPMIFNPYFDIILLKKAVYKNDSEWIKQHFPMLKHKHGFFRLRTSLFDYLACLCGCSTYSREYTNNNDESSFVTIEEKSVRTIYENNLYLALFNISWKSPRMFVQNLDQLFQSWNGLLPLPNNIEQGLLFYIDLYNAYYTKYMNLVFSKVHGSKFFEIILGQT